MSTAIQQTEQKHTPGPWNYENGLLYRRGVSPTGIGYTDTVLKIDDAAFEPSEADARLITAAPDMLEALLPLPTEWLRSGIASDPRCDGLVIKLSIEGTTYEAEITVGQLRAAATAIAKAEGR